MEGNVFKKVVNKFKNKMHKNTGYPHDCEYVFSNEEITKLSNENKEKMMALKKSSGKRVIEKDKSEKEVDQLILDNLDNNVQLEKKKRDILDLYEDKDKITYTKIVKKMNGELDNNNEEVKSKKLSDENKIKYTNLSDELQQEINEAIDKVDMIVLDSYIIKGKDLVQHNYTITYGEESLRFIYQVRHEFEVLIEYLIGFNNEKKGIFNKTTISDSLDDEWHYLKNYVKILEQIKSIKEK